MNPEEILRQFLDSFVRHGISFCYPDAKENIGLTGIRPPEEFSDARSGNANFELDVPGEAARRTGFTDQRYFSRCFHKKTGMSPTGYRLQMTDEQ